MNRIEISHEGDEVLANQPQVHATSKVLIHEFRTFTCFTLASRTLVVLQLQFVICSGVSGYPDQSARKCPSDFITFDVRKLEFDFSHIHISLHTVNHVLACTDAEVRDVELQLMDRVVRCTPQESMHSAAPASAAVTNRKINWSINHCA